MHTLFHRFFPRESDLGVGCQLRDLVVKVELHQRLRFVNNLVHGLHLIDAQPEPCCSRRHKALAKRKQEACWL